MIENIRKTFEGIIVSILQKRASLLSNPQVQLLYQSTRREGTPPVKEIQSFSELCFIKMIKTFTNTLFLGYGYICTYVSTYSHSSINLQTKSGSFRHLTRELLQRSSWGWQSRKFFNMRSMNELVSSVFSPAPTQKCNG